MRAIFVSLICLTLAGPANADISNQTIRAYNQALEAGTDAPAIEAASLNLIDEAISSPDNEVSGLLAFESAWTLCRIGLCPKALEAARFAQSQPVRPNGTDPSLEMRTVLTSFIEWKIDDSKENREQLVYHLASLETGDVSMVSMTAHKEHYTYCANKGAWRDARQAAEAAVEHTVPYKEELFNEYAQAELIRIAAAFNTRPKIDHYKSMLSLEREIETVIIEQTAETNLSDEHPLSSLNHRISAWAGGISAYLLSTNKRRQVQATNAEFPPNPALTVDTSDFCPGAFDAPPRLELIMGFDVKNGKTTNVRVLAAVPAGVFDKEGIRAITALTWSPEEGADTSQCSMVRRNLIYPISFVIRR